MASEHTCAQVYESTQSYTRIHNGKHDNAFKELFLLRFTPFKDNYAVTSC